MHPCSFLFLFVDVTFFGVLLQGLQCLQLFIALQQWRTFSVRFITFFLRNFIISYQVFGCRFLVLKFAGSFQRSFRNLLISSMQSCLTLLEKQYTFGIRPATVPAIHTCRTKMVIYYYSVRVITTGVCSIHYDITAHLHAQALLCQRCHGTVPVLWFTLTSWSLLCSIEQYLLCSIGTCLPAQCTGLSIKQL